jgi:general secretion pathway protein G
MQRARGFTLIELLVVLAILATLLTLATPRYFQHVDRAKEAVLRENLATTRQAIDQYHADKGTWPESLEALVEARYLRAVPRDPITESSETWLLQPPPEAEASTGSGVYDLKSGAEGSTLEGTPYADL